MEECPTIDHVRTKCIVQLDGMHYNTYVNAVIVIRGACNEGIDNAVTTFQSL